MTQKAKVLDMNDDDSQESKESSLNNLVKAITDKDLARIEHYFDELDRETIASELKLEKVKDDDINKIFKSHAYHWCDNSACYVFTAKCYECRECKMKVCDGCFEAAFDSESLCDDCHYHRYY
jgi:hypothetical protein